jgi:hypothetical protein
MRRKGSAAPAGAYSFWAGIRGFRFAPPPANCGQALRAIRANEGGRIGARGERRTGRGQALRANEGGRIGPRGERRTGRGRALRTNEGGRIGPRGGRRTGRGQALRTNEGGRIGPRGGRRTGRGQALRANEGGRIGLIVSKQRTTCRFSTLFLPIRIPQSEIRNRWQHFFGTGFAGLGPIGPVGRGDKLTRRGG